MTHSPLGLVHLIAALTAIALGAAVLFRRKGGGMHRLLGYAYAAAMVTLNGTALIIYRLTGRFNFLHGFALISLVTLLIGLSFAIRRRPAGTWLAFHYRFMGWSYIGLIAAFVAESSTRLLLPWLQHRGFSSFSLFMMMVGVVSALVCGVGARLIRIYGPVGAGRKAGPSESV